MPLIISARVKMKLAGKIPPVTEGEIIQCFANRTHNPLIDEREEHTTNPLTRWFVAETDYGRMLKIMYIPKTPGICIKSAYDATPQIVQIYKSYAQPIRGKL